jgi:rod shape-determining protein MreD
MSSSIYVAIPLMAILAIGQTAVLPRFPILGQLPPLPLLVALAWGLLRGIDEGIIWAFIAGFFVDIFSIGPMGVTSLTYIVAVTAVLWIQQAFPTSRVFLPILLAGLVTIIQLILYLFILRLLGVLSTFQVEPSLLLTILINAILILPIYWLLFMIDRRIRPRRVQI